MYDEPPSQTTHDGQSLCCEACDAEFAFCAAPIVGLEPPAQARAARSVARVTLAVLLDTYGGEVPCPSCSRPLLLRLVEEIR